MKKKSIISLLLLAMGFGMVATSCEDMLAPDSERHSYKVAQDTLYSYWGILKSMQNIAERYVILGECRGDLVDGTGRLTDSIRSILNYDMAVATDGSNRYLQAADYYHVINSCNAYLEMVDTLKQTGTKQPYMLKEAAQVAAIRAWTYLQLIQVYGEVPFYTNALTTTDKINAFANNPQRTIATADNLADLLAPSLVRFLPIEMEYGFPQYENYGYTTTVCHSTKCMIPLNLILGDLYLTKGDPQSCQKAAEYYYNYLGNNQDKGHITPGGPLPNGYECTSYMSANDDEPQFRGGSNPYSETGAVSKTRECITVIPSSTNKLWGNVLRGVNGVFGYDVTLSVHTNANDTATTASVNLTQKVDSKQLGPSAAYLNLAHAQTFEGYVGSELNEAQIYTDSLVGDGREYWCQTQMYRYDNDVMGSERFITKQNPNGRFTTAYPVIYRKSMVWLRYAEALNRAGYPSYAFAILKNGLCNNDKWYPTEEDYAVRDSAFTYTYTTQTADGIDTTITYPTLADDEQSPFRTKAALTARMLKDGIVADSSEIDPAGFAFEALSRENWVDEGNYSNAVLYYLDWNEVKRSPSFLNFDFTSFNGNMTRLPVQVRNISTERPHEMTDELTGSTEPFTCGVHSRGCGNVMFKDMSLSSYNYVDQIIARAQRDYHRTLTQADIYDPSNTDVVQNVVEDLIVDEEALELAFEGTRFFDLMRVAHRRSDPAYLASRVAKRNPALEGTLQNPKNWYFPLPQ